jgi:tRNA(Arg) A34 adenosine deaminase TadA
MTPENIYIYLEKAIEKARQSVEQGGFPAGAVVVKDGVIIGEGISIGNKLNDPTSHGEISAIRDACKKLSTSDLVGATLYASMEPCSMCHSASMWSGISKIVYACGKDKVSKEYYGGVYKTEALNTTFNKPIEIVQVSELEENSLTLVKSWESSFE